LERAIRVPSTWTARPFVAEVRATLGTVLVPVEQVLDEVTAQPITMPDDLPILRKLKAELFVLPPSLA
jgi:hypothetical protein